MLGRRLPDFEGDAAPPFAEGDYGKTHGGLWLACAPGGHLGNLAAHEVTEHDDGTISVSPSIKITTTSNELLWHGWLVHGVWTES